MFHISTLADLLSTVIWSWFPLGPAGIRTLLLFISALAVFVLRVAQLHSMSILIEPYKGGLH